MKQSTKWLSVVGTRVLLIITAHSSKDIPHLKSNKRMEVDGGLACDATGFRPEDGGDMLLRNVAQYLQDYKVP